MLRSSLIFIILLYGCGTRVREYTDTFATGQPLTAFDNKVALDVTAPSGLSVLIYKKDNELKTCTGFMISDRHLLTNSHCVSHFDTRECKGKLSVFIKTSSGQIKKNCSQKIISSRISSYTNLLPDYSVIEIDTPLENQKPFDLSRDGFEDREKYKILSFSMSANEEGSLFAEFKQNLCEARQKTLLGNFSKSISSIIPLFAPADLADDCKIMPGNSGSPILNSKDKVSGLIFATKSPNYHPEHGFSQRNISRNFSLATNLSCLKFGIASMDKDLQNTCKDHFKEEITDQDLALDTIKANAFTKALPSILLKLPEIFEYSEIFSNDLLGQKVTFNPLCKKPEFKLSEKGSIQLPTYRIGYELDSFLMASVNFMIEDLKTFNYAPGDPFMKNCGPQ